MQRIVVTGSECTGKTTLARELARWLNVPWLPEAARHVAEALGQPLTADHVPVIASRHMANEDALRRRAHPACVVLDTDLLSTIAYARHYYGDCPAWIVDEARARRANLYLLAAPDLPWTPDGIRDRPQARREIHAAFVHVLQTVGACVIDVDGCGPRRFANAVAGVRGWRAAATAL